MLQAMLFFILAFATIVAFCLGRREDPAAEEDPLADRLSELQNATLVGGASGAAAGGRMRRKGTGFLDRYLNMLSSIPGGGRLDQRQRRNACAWRDTVAKKRWGSIAVMRNRDCSCFAWAACCSCSATTILRAWLGGLMAAGIIGFMGPQFVLGKMATRYRAKLQEALPDTIDLLGIVLGTGLALDQAMMRVSEEMQYIYPELANEFYTVAMQVRAGQERAKAFSRPGAAHRH